MKTKPTILFQTEGSYPFHGGGVSTWAHILCSELEDEVSFIILALTGNPFVEVQYRLPPSIEEVIHVPLWGTEEPAQYYHTKASFSEHIARKARTTDKEVRILFLPLFRDFLECMSNPFKPAFEFGELIYGFWRFFQQFDYKTTLSHHLLWIEFKNQLGRHFKNYEGSAGEIPCVFDVTFGMRWFYHFMMPLAIPIPNVSISHATLAGFPTILSIAAKYEFGTPILLTDHGVFIRERLINVGQSEYPYFSKKILIDLSIFVTRAIYYHADLIAPVTSFNKKWEMKFEGSKERIRTIYNGVDTGVFRPEAKPEHTADRPTVVAAAHVFPLKDIETMIRSCYHVRQQIPEVQYILYGSLDVDPPYVKKCRALVEELDLEDNFIFGGFHENASMIYNEGDISILSSVSEGFPYTVIESMSCGRPVVSTDVGGIREALKGCGILCKPKDPKGLADGVIKLLKNAVLRFALGQLSRDRVLMNYTTPMSVENYLRIYRDFHQRLRKPLKYEITTPSVLHLMEKLETDYA